MPPERKSKPRSPDYAALGQAIEVLIAENPDIDKDKVSTASGLDIKQINELIRGTGNPQLSTLLRLAEGLRVRLGVLMTRTDELRDKRSGRS